MVGTLAPAENAERKLSVLTYCVNAGGAAPSEKVIYQFKFIRLYLSYLLDHYGKYQLIVMLLKTTYQEVNLFLEVDKMVKTFAVYDKI